VCVVAEAYGERATLTSEYAGVDAVHAIFELRDDCGERYRFVDWVPCSHSAYAFGHLSNDRANGSGKLNVGAKCSHRECEVTGECLRSQGLLDWKGYDSRIDVSNGKNSLVEEMSVA
jgi:hypothetical protein